MRIIFDEIKHETDLAVLLMFDGEKEWIPLSQIENDNFRDDRFVEIPRWLAEEKELEDFEE